jgi:hypothetical protein
MIFGQIKTNHKQVRKEQTNEKRRYRKNPSKCRGKDV